MPRFVALLVLALALLGAAVSPASAANIADEPVIPGVTQMIDFSFAPDGGLYVATKDGRIFHYRLAPGSTITNPIYAIAAPDLIYNFYNQLQLAGDRGLTSIAVDSSFATNHILWALVDRGPGAPGSPYTQNVRLTEQLVKMQLDPTGTVLVSTTVVLGADNPKLPGHTGTAIADYDPAGSCANPVDSSVYPGTGTFSSKTQIPDGDNTTTNDSHYDCWPADIDTHTADQVTSLPDGTLLVSNGDSSDYTIVAPASFRAQNVETLSGKVLHINRDGTGVASHPFCPAETDLTKTCTKVWVRGLRNPFRFSVVPGSNPLKIFLGDVGADSREAAYVAGAGDDAGWPCWEGSRQNVAFTTTPSTAPKTKLGGPEFDPAKTNKTYSCSTVPAAPDSTNSNDPDNPNVGPPTTGAVPLIRPVFEWSHYANGPLGTGYGNAAIGGPVLSSGRPYTNGIALPQSWDGSAFLSDYVQGWQLRFPAGTGLGGVQWPAQSWAAMPPDPASTNYDELYNVAAVGANGTAPWYRLTMRQAPDGSLWYSRFAPTDASQGSLNRLRSPGPAVNLTATSIGGGKTAFATTDDGAGTTYGFDLNGDGIPNSTGDGTVDNETGNTSTIASSSIVAGQYARVFVTKNGSTSIGQLQSACSAQVTPHITSPADGTLVGDGQNITITGTVSPDPAIPTDAPSASLLQWTELTIHGNSHVHLSKQGTGATFVATPVRDHGLESTTQIIVRHPECPTNTATITLHPQPVTLHLASNIPSLSIALQINDAQVNVTAPADYSIASGLDTQAAVPSTVVSGGNTWNFQQWSDGNTDPARAYEVPVAGGSLTATYVRSDTTPPPMTASLTNKKNWLYGYTVVPSAKTIGTSVGIGSAETSGPVAVAVTLTDSAGTLGSAAASIAPGASALVNSVLSTAGYQRVRATSWKGDSATEKVVATDTAGNATTVTTALRLHP